MIDGPLDHLEPWTNHQYRVSRPCLTLSRTGEKWAMVVRREDPLEEAGKVGGKLVIVTLVLFLSFIFHSVFPGC